MECAGDGNMGMGSAGDGSMGMGSMGMGGGGGSSKIQCMVVVTVIVGVEGEILINGVMSQSMLHVKSSDILDTAFLISGPH